MAQCSASFPFFFLEKYRNYHRAIFLVTSQVEKLLIRVWNHLLVIWWNKHVLFFVDEKIATFLWLSLDVYKKSKREVNLKGFLEYWIPSMKHSQLCPASRSWCLGESKRRLEKSPLRLLISFGWALSNKAEPRSLMNNMKVVVRINTMIIKAQMLCSFIKFSKLIFQGHFSGQFVCWYLGWKGFKTLAKQVKPLF